MVAYAEFGIYKVHPIMIVSTMNERSQKAKALETRKSRVPGTFAEELRSAEEKWKR